MDLSPIRILAAVIVGLNIPLCLGLGLMFRRGRGAGLVIHSQRELFVTDVPRLLRFLSWMMIAMAATFIPSVLGVLLGSVPLLFVGLGLFLAVAIGGAIYVNTGGRFRKF